MKLERTSSLTKITTFFYNWDENMNLICINMMLEEKIQVQVSDYKCFDLRVKKKTINGLYQKEIT